MRFKLGRAGALALILLAGLGLAGCPRRGQSGSEPRQVFVDRSKCVVILGDDTGSRDNGLTGPVEIHTCIEDNTAPPTVIEVPTPVAAAP